MKIIVCDTTSSNSGVLIKSVTVQGDCPSPVYKNDGTANCIKSTSSCASGYKDDGTGIKCV